MAASGRSVFQGGELSLKLTVYAWVPSQEELHSLWRADEPQTYPKEKKRHHGAGTTSSSRQFCPAEPPEEVPGESEESQGLIVGEGL